MSGRSSARRAARRALGLVALALAAVVIVAWTGWHPTLALGAVNASGAAAAASAEPADIVATAARARSTERVTLKGDEGASVEVYPPIEPHTERAPALVVLHGMCMQPRDVCDFWPAPGRGSDFVLCPRGNGECGGAPDWVGPIPSRVESAHRSLALAFDAHADEIDPERRVLIGYSRGAFLARDVLYAGRHRFSAAVFLGAAVTPDPVRLAAAGVKRVVLAAGDFDGAKPTMTKAAERLRAGGIEARFVSLGPMGHGLPANLAAVLEEPLAWARRSSDATAVTR
jgi:predicted esterase